MAEDIPNHEIHPHFAEINETLTKILCSAGFRDSKQLQSLLAYIVAQGLEGNDHCLKERIIGIEVFGRKSDYNTSDDPVVRSRVGQLRKRLEGFYSSDDARGVLFQIDIPSGSYRPTFELHQESKTRSRDSHGRDHLQQDGLGDHETSVDSRPPSHPQAAKRNLSTRSWAIVAAVTCILFSAIWFGFVRLDKSEFDLFWEPFLQSKKTVVLYVGTAPVYVPTESSEEKALAAVSADEQKLPIREWHVPSFDGQRVIAPDDIFTNKRDFVATGDIQAILDAAKLLTLHQQSTILRSGSNVPFEDLRNSPLILTGAGSNYWSLEMTRDLPFFLDRSLRIRENGGQSRVWSTPLWSDHIITQDYAIVSRLVDSKTGAPIMILAGITMCGTRAAGEFVTDPAQLKKLKGIPRSVLEHKNLEFVVHATLFDCTPTSLDVAAVRYW